MKRHFSSRNSRCSAFRRSLSPLSSPLSPAAFTLVEMLVVITIISILAGLITAAAVTARRRARIATIAMELKQLDMACQEYKNKFGEYPPDFAGIGTATTSPMVPAAAAAALRTAAQQTILRHLARAFPRYRPGVTTASAGDDYTWNGFCNDVAVWGLDPNQLSPASALVFWLGGQPDWFLRTSADGEGGVGTAILPGHTAFNVDRPFRGFLGFSANPSNPFDGGTGTSRIAPLFDFDLSRVAYLDRSNPNGLGYWPQGASGSLTTGSIVYFRAENAAYTVAYATSTATKCVRDYGDPANIPTVFPAVDVRLSNGPGHQYTWMNPNSFQILSAGMDVLYSMPARNPTFYPDGAPLNLVNSGYGPYMFPSGENYDTRTFDDITNFSNGTLDDAIP